MEGEDQRHDRRALLDFVEQHWRDLTLRDARALCVEIVEPKALAFQGLRVP